MTDSTEAPNKQRRYFQNQGLISALLLFLTLLGLAGYAMVSDARRAETIAQLSIALSEQREQFTQCTSGVYVPEGEECKDPVSATPDKNVESVEGDAGPLGAL